MITRKCVVVLTGIAVCGFLQLTNAFAQAGSTSQVNLQFNGLLPRNASGNGINDQATRAGGYQVNYAYQFNKWSGADVGFGMNRYTQNYSGDFGASSIQANLHQFTIDYLFHPLNIGTRIHPYLVAGVGALNFAPTTDVNNAAGANHQTRSAFLYGGGADFDLSKHIGIRAEYRGAKFKVPDFQIPELALESQTNIEQPSVGVYFKFSGVASGRK